MEIDRTAPIAASRDVDVDAPIEAVWAILTTIERWPEWNPDVKAVTVDGPLTPGATFRWKAGPSQITSRIEEVDAPRRIVWTGRTMGIRAVHVHELEERDGHTSVRSEESWSGLLPRLLRGPLHVQLTNSLEAGLDALKRAAEGRADRPAG